MKFNFQAVKQKDIYFIIYYKEIFSILWEIRNTILSKHKTYKSSKEITDVIDEVIYDNGLSFLFDTNPKIYLKYSNIEYITDSENDELSFYEIKQINHSKNAFNVIKKFYNYLISKKVFNTYDLKDVLSKYLNDEGINLDHLIY